MGTFGTVCLTLLCVLCFSIDLGLFLVVGTICSTYMYYYHENLHKNTWKMLTAVDSVFSSDDVCDQFCEGGADADLLKNENMVNVKKHRKFHYASRVALLAKSQVGLLSNSKANQLVYQRICRDEMLKHGVRTTHLARMLPLAVAACFIRTDEDRLAESVMKVVSREKDLSKGSQFLEK